MYGSDRRSSTLRLVILALLLLLLDRETLFQKRRNDDVSSAIARYQKLGRARPEFQAVEESE